MSEEMFMRRALELAEVAQQRGDVPVGAVLVREGRIEGAGFNQKEANHDPTAHAEIVALRQAAARSGGWRLPGATLYVTKEPCVMCAGALVHVRLRRVIFGCADPKAGAAGSTMNLLQTQVLNHRCEITPGVLQNECAAILQSFFQKKRNLKSDF